MEFHPPWRQMKMVLQTKGTKKKIDYKKANKKKIKNLTKKESNEYT